MAGAGEKEGTESIRAIKLYREMGKKKVMGNGKNRERGEINVKGLQAKSKFKRGSRLVGM